MSTGTDKARLQTLTDAIIAAQIAAQAIPPEERVVGCSFGEISTQHSNVYGNTKHASTHKPADNRDYNLREVIATGMTALARESQRATASTDREPPVVTDNDVDSAAIACVDCGAPLGGEHRPDCALIARQRARGSRR
jgi:predicted transcriptional regulator